MSDNDSIGQIAEESAADEFEKALATHQSGRNEEGTEAIHAFLFAIWRMRAELDKNASAYQIVRAYLASGKATCDPSPYVLRGKAARPNVATAIRRALEDKLEKALELFPLEAEVVNEE